MDNSQLHCWVADAAHRFGEGIDDFEHNHPAFYLMKMEMLLKIASSFYFHAQPFNPLSQEPIV